MAEPEWKLKQWPAVVPVQGQLRSPGDTGKCLDTFLVHHNPGGGGGATGIQRAEADHPPKHRVAPRENRQPRQSQRPRRSGLRSTDVLTAGRQPRNVF